MNKCGYTVNLSMSICPLNLVAQILPKLLDFANILVFPKLLPWLANFYPSYLWHSATLDLKRIEINWIDPHMIRDWVPLIEITIIGLIIISTRDLKKDLSNKSYWSSYDPGTHWVRGRTIGESSPRCSSLSWLSLECVIIKWNIDDFFLR